MVFSTSRKALEAHNVVRSVQFPHAGPPLHHNPCLKKQRDDARSSTPESPVRRRADLCMDVLNTLGRSSHLDHKQNSQSPPKTKPRNCVPRALHPPKQSLQSDWNNDDKKDLREQVKQTASIYAGNSRSFQLKRCSNSESSVASYMPQKLHTSLDPYTYNDHECQSRHRSPLQAGDSSQQSPSANKEASNEGSIANNSPSPTPAKCEQFEPEEFVLRGGAHVDDLAAPYPKKDGNLKRSRLNKRAIIGSSTSSSKLSTNHKGFHAHDTSLFKMENELGKFCRARSRFSSQSPSGLNSGGAQVATSQNEGSDLTSGALRPPKRRKMASHPAKKDLSGTNSVPDSESKASKGKALAKLQPRKSIAKKSNFVFTPVRRLTPKATTSAYTYGRTRLASLRSTRSHKNWLRQMPNQVGGGGVFSRSQPRSQAQTQDRGTVADGPSVRKEKDQESIETEPALMKSSSRSRLTRRPSSSLERNSEPVTRRKSPRLAHKRREYNVIVIDDSDEENGPDDVKRTKEADDLDITTLGFETLTLENAKTLKDLPPNPFLDPLSDEEETEVAKLYRQKDKKEIKLIPSARIVLRGEDFKRLRSVRWLNDEVINAYMSLVNVRNDSIVRELSDEERKHIPRTFVFNTFFYTRLTSSPEGYDYAGVRKWTGRGKMDVMKQDLLLFPVNLGNHHWVLAAIDQPRRTFLYLDSMAGSDKSDVLVSLRQWYYDELKDKHGEKMAKEMDLETWPSACNRYMIRRVGILPTNLEPRGCKPRLARIPVQRDGGSCGVFIAKIADCLSLGLKIYFNQDDIPLVRRRMALDLLRGQLGL